MYKGTSTYPVMSDEARSRWLDTVHTILIAAYNTNPEQSIYTVTELMEQSDAQGQSFMQGPSLAFIMLEQDSRFHKFGKHFGKHWWGLSMYKGTSTYPVMSDEARSRC